MDPASSLPQTLPSISTVHTDQPSNHPTKLPCEQPGTRLRLHQSPALCLQINQSKGAEGMLETRQAYEYALDRIGLDVQSGQLWQEYINFLQLPRPNTPAYRTLWAAGSAPGQEDSQRIMTLRCKSPSLHNIGFCSVQSWGIHRQLPMHLSGLPLPSQDSVNLFRKYVVQVSGFLKGPTHTPQLS